MAAMMLLLKCLTNLHVGNGDVNYNIIDNEVERDPVTNYPTINASGVKGALRAFLEGKAEKELLNAWLGAKDGTKPGQLKILQAFMLAMPMRATKGEEPYKLVYTQEMKKQYEELAEIFQVKKLFQQENPENVEVEGYTLRGVGSLQMPDEKLKLHQMKHTEFASCALPVLARNCLENGTSVNLWYEEVVPHKSIFYVPVVAEDKTLLEKFKDAVNHRVIQFGGGASIGYGLCKVYAVEGTV